LLNYYLFIIINFLKKCEEIDNEKKLIYFTILILFFLISSCSKNKSKKLFEYKQRNLDKIKSFESESQILSLSKEIIIDEKIDPEKRFWGLKYDQKHIIILKYYNGAVHGELYDNNGNYLDNIGRIGKGPGEYISISSAGFLPEKKIFVYDTARNIIFFYKIKNKQVEFLYQNNLGKFYQGAIDEVFFKNEKYYFMAFYGPKNTYKCYILEEDFNNLNILNKFHKRKNISSASKVIYTVNDRKMFFMGASKVNNQKTDIEYYDSYLYIYNLKGDFLNKIDIGWKNINCINVIKNFILVTEDGLIKIFDLNGNLVHKIKSIDKKNYYTVPNRDGNTKIYVNKIDRGQYKIFFYNYKLGF